MKCTMPSQTKTSSIYNDIPDGYGGYITQEDEDTYVIPARELSHEQCQSVMGRATDKAKVAAHLNARFVVTVRTSSGSAYTVETPATATVTIGQVWPLGEP